MDIDHLQTIPSSTVSDATNIVFDNSFFYKFLASHGMRGILILGILLAIILFFTRSRWIHLIPRISSQYAYTRASQHSNGFQDDIERGLTSDTFDLSLNNVAVGDSRSGLDSIGAEHIERIMQERGVSFDEARRIRHDYILAKNNIDPTGLPLDKKAVYFS